MKIESREDARSRLTVIAGQVQGLSEMVEQEEYCVDILTQVAALRAALDNFGVLMLSMHIEDCVYAADGQPDGLDEKTEARIEEVRLALSRFIK